MTMLDQIRDVADELTEPHIHSEPIRTWVNRNLKIRMFNTVQPGLLTQLYQSVIPAWSSGEAPSGGVPGSRPPLAVEALSRHDMIAMATLRWCRSLNLDLRVSPESNIRALVGAAAALDDDTQRVMLSELRQWVRWCAVLTGWESIYRPAGVACPVVDCGQTNTLRINLTAETAMCRACASTWGNDDGSIVLLADHIRARSERQGVA